MEGAGEVEDDGGNVFADSCAVNVGCEVIDKAHGTIDEGFVLVNKCGDRIGCRSGIVGLWRRL